MRVLPDAGQFPTPAECDVDVTVAGNRVRLA